MTLALVGLHGKAHVLVGRQIQEQTVLLECTRQTEAEHLLRSEPRHFAIGQLDRPGGRRQFSADEVEQRRNPNLAAGAILLLGLLLVCVIGPLMVNVDRAGATSVLPDQAPSHDFPLGTDDQGRDLAAVLVAGLPLTLRIGFIAGIVGLSIGIVLGFSPGIDAASSTSSSGWW